MNDADCPTYNFYTEDEFYAERPDWFQSKWDEEADDDKRF